MEQVKFGAMIGVASFILLMIILISYAYFVYRESDGRLRSLAINKFVMDPDRPNGDVVVKSAGWNGAIFAVVFEISSEDGTKTIVNRKYNVSDSCESGYKTVNGYTVPISPYCLKI